MGTSGQGMPIAMGPETEQLHQEAIARGHFALVDELIRTGVEAYREASETYSVRRVVMEGGTTLLFVTGGIEWVLSVCRLD